MQIACMWPIRSAVAEMVDSCSLRSYLARADGRKFTQSATIDITQAASKSLNSFKTYRAVSQIHTFTFSMILFIIPYNSNTLAKRQGCDENTKTRQL